MRIKDSSIIIHRYGVQLDCSTIILEFSKNKINYIKKIRVTGTENQTSVAIFGQLKEKYSVYFNTETVDVNQVISIIEKIKTANAKNSKANDSISPKAEGGTMIFKPLQASRLSAEEILDIDLNTCSDEVNRKAKELMDIEFSSRRLQPGDEGFVYDKQVDFAPPSEAADWDDEDDE